MTSPQPKAFSLGRTQRMVYCFQELFTVHKVRPIPVYVDSPLALRLTDIHREHPDAYTPFARKVMEKDPILFGADFVHFCGSWDESRRLNHMEGPMIIIASSGMCEAGRIKHHLKHSIEDPDNAVVIVTQADPKATPADMQRVAAGYRDITREAVTIPFDQAMVDGVLHYGALRPSTQRAWLAAAAAVARGL